MINVKLCIGPPVEFVEMTYQGEKIERKIGVAVVEEHLSDRVLEGACSYDQLIKLIIERNV